MDKDYLKTHAYDIIFIIGCIMLILFMVYEIYSMEIYKINAKKLCLQNPLRVCWCHP